MAAKSFANSQGALRKSFFLCTIDGLAAVPLAFFSQPGNYIVATLLTKLYKMSEDSYGIMVSLPYWCNFAQLFFLPLIVRHLVAKRVTLISGWLHLFAWLVFVAALPSIPIAQPDRSALIFFYFFLIFSLLFAWNTVAWNSWVQEWAWESLRGRYFGYRNKLIQLMTVGFLAAVGVTANVLPINLVTFQILFLAALALRAISLLAQTAMKVGRVQGAHHEDVPHLSQLRIIGRSPSLLLFIVFGMVWGLASNCFGPFYPVFLLRELNFSPSNLTVLVVLTSVSLALSFPGWGALLDRFGNKAVMVWSMALIQIQNYLWCFLTPHNSWMLYPMYIWGGYATGGFVLGLFNLLLKLAPPQAKTLAIGLNLAATSLVMACAAMAGGHLLALGRQVGYSGLALYHLAFFFQPTLALLSCLILLRIKEPRASGLEPVARALLTLATMSSLIGLPALRQAFAWRSANRKDAVSRRRR